MFASRAMASLAPVPLEIVPGYGGIQEDLAVKRGFHLLMLFRVAFEALLPPHICGALDRRRSNGLAEPSVAGAVEQHDRDSQAADDGHRKSVGSPGF
jgi:hypothetical protein